jgi:hypothetical protein
LRVPPMAGPPPGRQQPPNSSDTRESIRRCPQPPARPLPPRHRRRRRRRPSATAASSQPEESGVGPCEGHAPTSWPPGRVRNGRGARRDIESSGLEFSLKERGPPPIAPKRHRGERASGGLGRGQGARLTRKGRREL